MEIENENWNKYYLKALYGLNNETKFAFFNKYYKNVLKEFTMLQNVDKIIFFRRYNCKRKLK